MSETVAQAHPVLYHYTTAGGLQGIIQSQQLWATRIDYLNDAEEHIGFLNRRLPQLVEQSIERALPDMHPSRVAAFGGRDAVLQQLRPQLSQAIGRSLLDFNAPYVVSLCSPPIDGPSDDGLLSQWRGYGIDGGYVIVFDSVGMEQLLIEEGKRFNYQTSHWADAEYSRGGTTPSSQHPETTEHEEAVMQMLREFIVDPKPEALEEMHSPLTQLATTYKHGGFREEAEVRIVAVPANPALVRAAAEAGEVRPEKPIHFGQRGGLLVPRIELFGDEGGPLLRLPISKIIVGPHHERLTRQRSVELLLKQHSITAPVVVSQIPYIGR